MVAYVYSHPRDRDERLLRLGVNRTELLEVVRACVAGRGGSTDNDPKSAGAQFAWIYGTRRLREVLRPKGLEKEVFNGVETIADRKRKIRFAVVSTDRGTTDPDRSPRNRTEKGPASEKIADLNNQYEMGFVDTAGSPITIKGESDGYSFWYLCIFDDGTDVRAELSSPVEFKSGYFVKFSERIFLVGPGEWGEISISTPGDDTGPEVQIDVRRK